MAQTNHAAPLLARPDSLNDIRHADINHNPDIRLAHRAIGRY